MVEKNKKISVFDLSVIGISLAFAVFFAIPLLFVLANAFSDPKAVYTGKVLFFPVRFCFDSFVEVFQDNDLLRGYWNTIKYTTIGTVIQVALQFSVAYPLSRRDLKGKKFFNMFFAIPMFIGGGMIPTYLVVKALDMLNTSWAIIIPGCLGLYNIIIIRTYLTSSIPYELTEAGMVDGCGPLRCFFAIVFPLCKPILCVMILYAIVGYWNSYFNSLIYTSDDSYWPLQRVLQRMLIKSETSGSLGEPEQLMKAEGMKYATIIVSSLPLLVLYPFFQKYFEKGVMLGSIKG